MKFGVREICDVVLKAKAPQKIGNKIFYKDEPVLYFDTLKTSTMEGAATTVYAQGGRGNTRLVAWEGERTVTFTMEDALISPEGFMVLSGAGLIEASAGKPVFQHVTEVVDGSRISGTDNTLKVLVKKKPYLPVGTEDTVGIAGNYAYVMLVKNGEIISEPYIPNHYAVDTDGNPSGPNVVTKDGEEYYEISVEAHGVFDTIDNSEDTYIIDNGGLFKSSTAFDSVIVDYYVKHISDAQQIEITADKFGGNYYLEASTLFRDQNGVDMPAEFVIPNCKIQSNFTFSMASSGDPTTFTFTMDAFPDYTRFDKSKKVLAAIQIIKEGASVGLFRNATNHDVNHEIHFN